MEENTYYVLFFRTVGLKKRHVKVLEILKTKYFYWKDNALGRVLDDLTSWGLARADDRECYSITTDGMEALKQLGKA